MVIPEPTSVEESVPPTGGAEADTDEAGEESTEEAPEQDGSKENEPSTGGDSQGAEEDGGD